MLGPADRARDHLVVPLDVAGQQPVRQLVTAVAALVAAGVPVASEALLAHLALLGEPDRFAAALEPLLGHLDNAPS